MSQVKQNDTVKVHYTGKLTNGQIFDSSLEREPLEVTLGEGKLIPGFENAIIDMKLNDKKTVEISKEDAYGDILEDLFHHVPKEQLPQDITDLITEDEEVHLFNYPVISYPTKVNSINLEKEIQFTKKLMGIRGQYLLFDDNTVINIRKYGGYQVIIE